MTRAFTTLTAGCILAAGTALFGQEPGNSASATAGQQKLNNSDRETAQEIRKAIEDDGSLSTYAHNVKVIVRNGNVTLKGPVYSEDEKKTVESYASKVAGANNVNNQITVKGD
ncbi:MAG TPA: BON domain-containing protein [Bryobacteraceae bacterium]|nr:BON domain-containing protein [Bryobacteraceae bacterium]